MRDSDVIGKRMLPLASLLLEHGADLFCCDQDGYSGCMLIFQSQYGPKYIKEFVYRFIDLDTFMDTKSRDLWLISSIARCIPSFQRRLEAAHRELRSPHIISFDINPRQDEVLELNPDVQIAWLKTAEPGERVPFMRTLCSFGTVDMVRPFIECGLDLEETDGDDSKTYIRSAARMGNLDVVVALMEAGASLVQPSWFWRRNNLCTSVLEELLERWAFMIANRPIQGRGSPTLESEIWILPRLLQRPGHASPNALFAALGPVLDPEVLRQLLEHGYGRRDGQLARTHHEEACGSELIEIVKHHRPYLSLLLDYGLGLECEDRLGVTAVLYATDLADTSYLEMLIQAGANMSRRPRCGITPMQLVESNMKASHPRQTNRAWSFFGQKKTVSLEEDIRTYELLKHHLTTENKSFLPFCKFPLKADKERGAKSIV